MCELFALSSRHATTVQLSLEEFSRHGGLSGAHKDGWGIAWYEDRDVRLVKEIYPASESACVSFVQQHPPQSGFVLSHTRKATRCLSTPTAEARATARFDRRACGASSGTAMPAAARSMRRGSGCPRPTPSRTCSSSRASR